jgi:hypothetical protein
LIWVLKYPLQAVFAILGAIWRWIRSMIDHSNLEQQTQDADSLVPQFAERAEGAVGADWVGTVMQIVQYPLAVLVAAGVLVVLILTFRRLRRDHTDDEASERDSVRGDASVGEDLLRLFGRLVPEWMRRAPSGRDRRYPAGEPGISEVFILYFKYLSEAIRRGLNMDEGETPNERKTAMEAVLPGAPIDVLTDRFNAACYGREPTDRTLVATLERSLDDLRRKGNGPPAGGTSARS